MEVAMAAEPESDPTEIGKDRKNPGESAQKSEKELEAFEAEQRRELEAFERKEHEELEAFKRKEAQELEEFTPFPSCSPQVGLQLFRTSQSAQSS
jgi:hypothetical protein